MAGAGYKLFNTGDVLTAAQVNTYLQEQVVMVFANATARTTALSGVLAEGMMSYLQDTNAVEVYNGSSWVNVGNAGDITEVQAGTGISVASGTGPIPVVTNTVATTFDAKGDLVVGTGADTFAKLTVGTNGHTLVADSSETTGLKWAAASGGGITLIQETVASSNTGIDFTSISGSYKQLMLVWSGLTQSGSGGGFGLRANADSTNNYAYSFGGTNASAVFQASSNGVGDFVDAQNGHPLFGYGFTSTDYHRAAKGYIIIDNYASTTRFKPWWGIFTTYDGNQKNAFGSGVYKSTSAITQLNIVRFSGSDTISNQASTSIRLYGVS